MYATLDLGPVKQAKPNPYLRTRSQAIALKEKEREREREKPPPLITGPLPPLFGLKSFKLKRSGSTTSGRASMSPSTTYTESPDVKESQSMSSGSLGHSSSRMASISSHNSLYAVYGAEERDVDVREQGHIRRAASASSILPAAPPALRTQASFPRRRPPSMIPESPGGSFESLPMEWEAAPASAPSGTSSTTSSASLPMSSSSHASTSSFTSSSAPHSPEKSSSVDVRAMRRHAKVSRALGDDVPPELVFPPHPAVSPLRRTTFSTLAAPPERRSVTVSMTSEAEHEHVISTATTVRMVNAPARIITASPVPATPAITTTLAVNGADEDDEPDSPMMFSPPTPGALDNPRPFPRDDNEYIAAEDNVITISDDETDEDDDTASMRSDFSDLNAGASVVTFSPLDKRFSPRSPITFAPPSPGAGSRPVSHLEGLQRFEPPEGAPRRYQPSGPLQPPTRFEFQAVKADHGSSAMNFTVNPAADISAVGGGGQRAPGSAESNRQFKAKHVAHTQSANYVHASAPQSANANSIQRSTSPICIERDLSSKPRGPRRPLPPRPSSPAQQQQQQPVVPEIAKPIRPKVVTALPERKNTTRPSTADGVMQSVRPTMSNSPSRINASRPRTANPTINTDVTKPLSMRSPARPHTSNGPTWSQTITVSSRPRTSSDAGPPPSPSPYSTLVRPTEYLDVPSTDAMRGAETKRSERQNGWSGEWNKEDMRDVIRKLRELK
ncbi:hypothetical protein PLICRDRAFT_31139 [Plicaturopsis crispa FD-325 SS-3]|nr:hypothetical protein PLICRDRAFT_31139 [Plicaturopsis crispa FD-325 SS-3]